MKPSAWKPNVRTSTINNLYNMVSNTFEPKKEVHVRGRDGRIACLPLAWKAATLIELGIASLVNAFRMAFLDRTDVLMAGELEDSFEKARFEAAAKQVFCIIVGLTIEAILTCCTVRNGVEM